jgi:DNA-directed RNA polymerase subunit RPC12/RpoP
MPIRFRCAYCNQLMGIAHRKVGSVVRCPKCSGQVIVPHVEQAPVESASGSSGSSPVLKSLEDAELEMLLFSAAKEAAGISKRKPKREGPPKALLHLDVDVEPVDLTTESPSVPACAAPLALPPATASMPRWVICSAATLIVLLLGLAFLLGLLFGKHFHS